MHLFKNNFPFSLSISKSIVLFKIDYEVLRIISNRIINEVKGINRVVYDISSKPPSTIEWE